MQNNESKISVKFADRLKHQVVTKFVGGVNKNDSPIHQRPTTYPGQRI